MCAISSNQTCPSREQEYRLLTSRQREMRLFEILLLLALCLVFVKADDENIFEKQPPIETGFTGEEVTIENLDDGTDEAEADPAFMNDAPNDRRQISRPVSIPMYVPGNMNSLTFKMCYCFRRLCYVPGMRQGFHGWYQVNRSGYVVIGRWLYRFYLCRPTGGK